MNEQTNDVNARTDERSARQTRTDGWVNGRMGEQSNQATIKRTDKWIIEKLSENGLEIIFNMRYLDTGRHDHHFLIQTR